MGDLLHALHAHQPLPRGSYPTAKWPEGCTHLKPADKIAHVYTLRPYVLPRPAQIVSVTVEGATHTVALDQDVDQPGGPWIDSIMVGGKWHSAVDTFRDDFIRALEKAVREDMAYESDAAAGMPEGVVMP